MTRDELVRVRDLLTYATQDLWPSLWNLPEGSHVDQRTAGEEHEAGLQEVEQALEIVLELIDRMDRAEVKEQRKR